MASHPTIRKLLSAAMSLVLAAGLAPTPALADGYLAADGADLGDQTTLVETSDPSEIVVPDDYDPDLSLSWLYTHEGDAGAGLKVTFAEGSVTEQGYDFVTVSDGDGRELAKLSGDIGGYEVLAPGASKLLIAFTSDGGLSFSGFSIASIGPMSQEDEAAAAVGEAAAREAFNAANVTIDGKAASQYADATYTIAGEGQDQALPEVEISADGVKLKEGRDFMLEFDPFPVKEMGKYKFSIAGIGPSFNGRSVWSDGAEKCEWTFHISADVDDVKSMIDAFEVISPEEVDSVYPDPDDKYSAMTGYLQTARDITAAVESLGSGARQKLGDEAFARYESIAESASQYVVLDDQDTNTVMWVVDSSGTEHDIMATFLSADGTVDVKVIAKCYVTRLNSETGEYEWVSLGILKEDECEITFRQGEGDETPNITWGMNNVIVTGKKQYIGREEFWGAIWVVDHRVYAALNGDTITLQPDYPTVFDEVFVDADYTHTASDGEDSLNRYQVPAWNQFSDAVKHVVFVDGVKPNNLEYLFNRMSALKSVDFTGIDASAADTDYHLFQGCTSLRKLTFGEQYRPSNASDIRGSFVSPDDPDTVWTPDQLSDHMDETRGTWYYDAESQLWTQTPPPKEQVAAPQAARGLSFDNSEKAGVPEGDGYTLSGTAKATRAGTYVATASLDDPDTTEWDDGTTDDRTIEWSIAKSAVDAPKPASGLVFNGRAQEGVGAVRFVKLSGTTKAAKAGAYTATASLEFPDSTTWRDGTTGAKALSWSISPAKIAGFTLAAKSATFDGKAHAPKVAAASYPAGRASASDYTVTYTRNGKPTADFRNAGAIAVTVTGKGDLAGSATQTFTIAKAANSKFSAKAKKASHSVKRGKNATLAASKVFKVANKGGAVTYAKASGNKKISVSSKGKVTVKKGLKKGTYTVKVKVKAKANANYKASATKTVTFKVKVV